MPRLINYACNTLLFFGVTQNGDKINYADFFSTDDKILCFDDLERVSEGKLGDLLGYINVFVEDSGSHTFFICNENKIHDKDKKVYTEYKEKLIRYTWKPQIEFSTILENLCNSFPAHFAKKLGYVYNRAKCKNIRIVKANIEVMHKMWNVLQNYENEETHAYFIFLTAYYCIVFHEYGEMKLQDVVDFTESEITAGSIKFGYDKDGVKLSENNQSRYV